MTDPLTPADCDLRDFPFMQVDVQRLLASETWVLGTADEKAAAITLWLASWHQVPAASVPSNDRMLAHLSQAGAKWPKVKEHALRGWVDGGDGRLYHHVVAEKALAAWIEKLNSAISGAAGNAKRWGTDVDTSDQEAALCDSIERLKRIAPASPCLKKKAVATRNNSSPPDRPPMPNSSPPDRNREGEREREINTPIPPAKTPGAVERFERFWLAYPKKVGKDAAQKAFDKRKPDEKLLVAMLSTLAVQTHSPQWSRDGGQFIPNPTTWLNQGRWQDGEVVGAEMPSMFAGGI